MIAEVNRNSLLSTNGVFECSKIIVSLNQTTDKDNMSEHIMLDATSGLLPSQFCLFILFQPTMPATNAGAGGGAGMRARVFGHRWAVFHM